MGGFNTRLYLDFRDRKLFATRGLEFMVENTSYISFNGASGNFGLAESYLKYYATTGLLLPVTLVGKVGGSINYGRQIPYYKYTYLGQFNNLRGYLRNRFAGDASAYLNSELRIHFGRVRNLILPFETGLIGFYDIGRVWFEGKSEGSWHAGYGGGFYISPFTRDYLFSVLLESSVEESLLFRLGIGFFLDR
jgi:hemolysin activation/secretion protein